LGATYPLPMRPGFFLFFYGIFFLVGSGLIIGGFSADPAALTDDGHNLKTFLYFMGGFFLVFPLLILGTIYFFIRRSQKRREYLLQHGQRGTATILAAQRTGLLVNRIPQLLFKLRITSDLGETYDLQHRQLYDGLILGPVPVGKEVPVYIDPKNKQNVLVMWEEA
jgi:hypothetical protein